MAKKTSTDKKGGRPKVDIMDQDSHLKVSGRKQAIKDDNTGKGRKVTTVKGTAGNKAGKGKFFGGV